MTDNKDMNAEKIPVNETENDQIRSEEIAAETHPEKETKDDRETGKKSSARKAKKDKRDETIEKLNKSLEEISDKHLRLQAEFDNYRRRTLKEKAELIKSGGESILVNILPVIDDFDRAMVNMKDIADDNPAKQGVLLIFNKFKEFLKQNNVREIEALNREFDCDYHEAVTKTAAASDDLKGKNVDVIQKGYTLNDKVIRFAKVVVGE